ncbi:activator-dependent family glycosyltransferase [Marinactinospora rubrisoli]|uniref:Activator-dependent family glycosyltransferase n=1 Tax=Marinactinospora rubrisoli TaxID=2715399 RepID=A0ABW2KNK2_9ACTN
MKVLFTSLPHSTHYYPMVPIAWALRTAGHEVRVASQPELTDTITRTGLTAAPVQWSGGDPLDAALLEGMHEDASRHVQEFDHARRDPDQWTWERLLALETIMVPGLWAALNTDAMIDDLLAFARAWRPDLVVWETYTMAGAVVARTVGAAHARMVSSVDVTIRARQEFLRLARAQPPEHREDPAAEWLTWTLERVGCPHGFHEELITGQWTIDCTAPATRLPLGLPTVSVRQVPYNGPSVLPDWLREPPRRPRVCLTFGVSGSLAPDTVAAILTAVAELDAEIVATIDAATRESLAGLAAMPDNVRVVDFVPMNDLLPTCAAVVHHGGVGTSATAQLHGVPQVIVPFGWDTTAMADNLERAGAGLGLPVTALSPEALRDRVHRVLTEPAFADGARRLREAALAEPAPNDIVPILQRLTARHRTPGAG